MEGGRKFRGGIEKANLILSTGLLQRSWLSILELQRSPHLRFFVQNLPKCTIVAFSADHSQPAPEALQPTLQPLNEKHPTLGFLATKRIPSVSIHSAPLSAFLHLLDTTDLKEKLKNLTSKGQPRLILVGESLGGSVAALCTLWLLKSTPPLPPICITFGSPLLGDAPLQKAVSNIEPWKTQFWHVVGHGDPIPRLFLPNSFRPFGTYFLVSGSSCACFDDPDSVVQLLEFGRPNISSAETNFKGYGFVLKQLQEKSKYRSNVPSTDNFQDSLKADLSLQLAAAGIGTNAQGMLLCKLEKNENAMDESRKRQGNPSKKLNEVKKWMAKLEWYKKYGESMGKVYYDCYKKRTDERDFDIVTLKNSINAYWKKKVEEAESKPQAPDARMRTRWLFSGVTYMRMVEPLDIADYFRKKDYPSVRAEKKDYPSDRAEHYKLLDRWNKEEAQIGTKKKDKAPSLTEDSCFWARVEEATLKLDELLTTADVNREFELKKGLIEFEAYIMKLVNNYELSPEVFLRESSFLDWWRKYERKLAAGGYYSPRIPLELPQGSQEQGAVIRWWSEYEEEAEPAGEHCSSKIHVRFWNGLGLSSEGFLETKSEFMARWRKEEQGLNPADTSPFACFMKGKYYESYK
ncbi:senescence-associated carboxylesterase 101-like [Nymphaea colorata]|nr:senescence-associated carboxylesterase 101-like [Nymphaea colorata]